MTVLEISLRSEAEVEVRVMFAELREDYQFDFD